MADDDVKHWVYAGGIDYQLTEGDLICVFSQFGEVEEFILSRDRDTGKPRGFGFAKYADPRSCQLAVDNFNGSTVSGRILKVSFANNLNVINSIKSKPILGVYQRDDRNGSDLNKRFPFANESSNYPRRFTQSMRQRSESSGSEIERRPRAPYRDDYRSSDRRAIYKAPDLKDDARSNSLQYNRGDTFNYRNGDQAPASKYNDGLKQSRNNRSRSSSTSSSSSSTSSSSTSSTSSSSSSANSNHKRKSRKDSHRKKSSSRKHHKRRHHKSKGSKHDNSSDDNDDEASGKRRRRHKRSKPTSSSPSSSHHRKRKSKSKSHHKTRSRSRSPSSNEHKSHRSSKHHSDDKSARKSDRSSKRNQ